MRNPLAILLFIAFGIGFFLNSCSRIGTALDDSPIVASYDGNSLSRAHLNQFLPEEVVSLNDSARYARLFIEQWLKNQAIRDVALKQYPDLEAELAAKVEDYQSKLIIHEYNTRFIKSRLDTNVTDTKIQLAYDKDEHSFIAKENLYSFHYVVTEFEGINKVKSLLAEDNQENLESLKKWVEENKIQEAYLDSDYQKGNKLKEIQKTGAIANLFTLTTYDLIGWVGGKDGVKSYHFFKKLNYLPVGDKLPIEVVRDNLKNQILNQRKIDLIDKNEELIINEAKAQNKLKGL